VTSSLADKVGTIALLLVALVVLMSILAIATRRRGLGIWNAVTAFLGQPVVKRTHESIERRLSIAQASCAIAETLKLNSEAYNRSVLSETARLLGLSSEPSDLIEALPEAYMRGPR
jgi:hypothetical protein